MNVLRTFSPRVRTVFVGGELESAPEGVQHRQVRVPSGPRSTAPRRFRASAAAALAQDRPRRVLSLGANCPPGDAYWVQSVHRSWLEAAPSVVRRGVTVPGPARRALPRHRVLLRLEREYFTEHRPDAVLCTSQREVDDLRRLYGVPHDVLHVVPNGYDGSRFTPANRGTSRAQVRAAMGLADGDISLLFVVNELHRKGFAVLLEAVAALSDPRLGIDVVGRVTAQGWESTIARLGLAGRVRWHGATATVERYMAAADSLVLPTQYEPFGLVVVEALASGLPVIVSELAGAAPAVTPDCGRLLRDPQDADELAAHLQEALRPGVLDAWSSRAPESARPYEWGEVLSRAEPLILGRP